MNNHPVKLILLGTGTPNADPQRSGSGAAVIVNDQAYLVDFGPGIVRRAAAAHQNGIPALAPSKLTTAFLTHLHSDHTIGLPDLLLTPWVLEREQPLRIFGPPGTQKMADHILAAYDADIRERINGLEPANKTGYQAAVTEIDAGLVFQDDHISVEAIQASHGSWPAFSYKFHTPQGVIVISGDTTPYPGIESNYAGCDILLHEVYSFKALQSRPKVWQNYHTQVHTSTIELAQIARGVEPKLLVLYHQLFWGISETDLVKEITSEYRGKVISGRDLDVFTLPLT